MSLSGPQIKYLVRYSQFQAKQPVTDPSLTPLTRMNIVQKEWLEGDGLDVVKELKTLHQQPIDASSGSSAFAPDEEIEAKLKATHTTQLIEYNNHLPQANFVQAADKYFHQIYVLPESIHIKQDVYDKATEKDYFSIVGHGTTELFNSALKAIIKSKGDVVIVTSPTYGLFLNPILQHQATIEMLPLTEKQHYKPSAQALSALIKATHVKLQQDHKKKMTFTEQLLNHFMSAEKIPASEKAQLSAHLRTLIKCLSKSIDHFENIDKATQTFNDALSKYDPLWKEKLELPFCPRVRGYFHINPHMPLGTICTQPEIDKLAVALEAFPDVTVIDDLTYYDLILSTSIRPGTFANSKLKERTLTLYSVSKQFALAGVRSGIALGVQKLILPIAKDIFNTVNTVNTFSTEALYLTFTWGSKKRIKYLEETNTEYAFRRDFAISLVQGIQHITNKKQVTRIHQELSKFNLSDEKIETLLNGISGLSITHSPDSGYFLLVDFSSYKGKFLGTTQLNQSRDFRNAFYCLTDVNAVPGELMYEFDKPILRFSYSLEIKDILEGLLRIKAVLELTKTAPLTIKEIQEAQQEEASVKVSSKKKEKPKTFTPQFHAKRLTDEENFKKSMTNIISNRKKGKRKVKPTFLLK
jgi:aspartate/methionine/tyrosine aminotransferase